jgi:hypothetical protein
MTWALGYQEAQRTCDDDETGVRRNPNILCDTSNNDLCSTFSHLSPDDRITSVQHGLLLHLWNTHFQLAATRLREHPGAMSGMLWNHGNNSTND